MYAGPKAEHPIRDGDALVRFPKSRKPNILCAFHILPPAPGVPCTLLPTSLMPSSSRFFLSALPCRPFWSESTSPDQPSYFTKAPECELPPLGIGMRLVTCF